LVVTDWLELGLRANGARRGDVIETIIVEVTDPGDRRPE